jgi:hypothetical protein
MRDEIKTRNIQARDDPKKFDKIPQEEPTIVSELIQDTWTFGNNFIFSSPHAEGSVMSGRSHNGYWGVQLCAI